MRFSDEYRKQMFIRAKDIDPFLGDLFQNPMDVTEEDLQQEIDRVYDVQRNFVKKCSHYIGELGMPLCFPDQEKEKGNIE